MAFDSIDRSTSQVQGCARQAPGGVHAIPGCVTMDLHELIIQRKSMNITVQNTVPDTARITLVGELHDGSFKAKVMPETAVPYTPYWDNLLEQRIVYIQPDDGQLGSIVAALNERRLSLDELQNYGSSDGGTSSIPV
jgi:hypothetical protein